MLTPSRLAPASKVTEALDRAAAPASRPQSRGLNGLIPAGDLCGLPAISLPCGFADKLPVAISFAGRPFYENQLLALGKLYQSQTDWHRQHPPIE